MAVITLDTAPVVSLAGRGIDNPLGTSGTIVCSSGLYAVAVPSSQTASSITMSDGVGNPLP